MIKPTTEKSMHISHSIWWP